MTKRYHLCLKRLSRPEEVDDHPLEQIQELEHPEFMARFGPSRQADGICDRDTWRTSITLLRYVTDVVGEGPALHVHPYDEIFMITEGRARFIVGDRTIDAEAGDVGFGSREHSARL